MNKMSRKSFKQWLSNANGCKRIWFICSIICFIYFIVIFPLTETNKGSLFRYEGLWAAEKEMKNTVCAAYMSEDFNKLVEPKYSTDGSTCYHIFSHRKYSDEQKPVTEKQYQDDFSSNERLMWFKYIGFGFLIATFLSAFVYFSGVVISWVIKGFKKSELP
jgi:hypothetical protein